MSAARTPREVRYDEQSVLSGRRGAPWWAVVLLALVLTAVGAGIDLARTDDLGVPFRVLYVTGCVVAVLTVTRRGLFAAMVQPPLVLVVTVPLMAEVVGRAGRGGLRSTAIAMALPLVNAFPTTAITTLVVLVLGGLRLVLRRRRGQADPVARDGDDHGTSPTRPPLPGTLGGSGDRSAARGQNPRPRRGADQAPAGGDDPATSRPRSDGAREPRRYGPSSAAAPSGRHGDRSAPPLPVNPRVPPAGRHQSEPGPRPDSWRPDSRRSGYQWPDAGRPDSSPR